MNIDFLCFSIKKHCTQLCLLIGFCLFSGSFEIHAQQVIRGTVKDEATKQAIVGVNIRLENTYSGTTTNQQGIFELRVRNLPQILLVTHIAYFGKQLLVTQKQADPLNIQLALKPIDLEEAEITGETYQVFKGKHQEVIDYDFLDTNILILAYNFNRNRHELILTNEDYDTIFIQDVSSIKKPTQIVKDCMANCHLLTRDSTYQIHCSDEMIVLLYPSPWEKFHKTLGSCLFETYSHLAFEGNKGKKTKDEFVTKKQIDLSSTMAPTAQSDWNHFFYLVNKKTGKHTVLDKTNEWKKTRDAYDHAMFIADDPNTKRSFGDILRFAQMVYFKPAFQTIKYLNDSIYYFNHLESRIDIYSEDLVLRNSIPIQYHKKENWKAVIITDKTKNKAYTVFTRGAKYALAEIDLQDGSVQEVTKIEKLFPQKIRVNNGHLYFLYQDLNNVWGRKKLFKGKMVHIENQ